jgi:hypothetical protein
VLDEHFPSSSNSKVEDLPCGDGVVLRLVPTQSPHIVHILQ